MDVENALGPAGHKIRRENGEESGQDDEVHPVFRQLERKRALKGLLAHLLAGHGYGGYAVVGGPGQGVGVFVAGAHQHDLSVGNGAGFLRLEQSLQIGAAAGDKDGDAGLAQHTITRSSPVTISPMA